MGNTMTEPLVDLGPSVINANTMQPLQERRRIYRVQTLLGRQAPGDGEDLDADRRGSS